MKKLGAKQTIKQKRGFIFISSHSWTPPVQLWFYEHFSNELCVWNGGGALLGLASLVTEDPGSKFNMVARETLWDYISVDLGLS